MNRMRGDSLVIGFALFSMFFGAGNVIFPPYLGLSCGSQWFLGFACYYLADIGLALLAIFAILHCGDSQGITRRAGRGASALLMSAIVLCIGPMLAIPRTAALTYEMSVGPLVSGFSPVLFSVLFFLLIFLLCVRESAVVDIVGKILTPVLLLGLLALIVKGVLMPIGPVPDRVLVENVPFTGIEAGYQTMDVLAALVFGIIILKSARDKGHTGSGDLYRVVAGAALVAGTALLVVYLGLTYLGVSASRFFGLDVPRTFLVVSIVRNLMGSWGIGLFSVVVALACITTAVALTSSAASYFSQLSDGRLSYPILVGLVCAFSAVVSNVGLEQIVAIAAPILNIVYPPTLVLIFLAFCDGIIRTDRGYRFAALGAFLTSLLTAAADFGLPVADLMSRMPLSSLGFQWVLPAVVCGLLGALPIGRRRRR